MTKALSNSDLHAHLKSLERALDLLHDINTKLYIAEVAADTPLGQVDALVSAALKSGHVARDLSTDGLELPRAALQQQFRFGS